MSSQCLQVEGQRKKGDGKKEKGGNTKEKNKNVSFHQTFAFLFSGPTLKRGRGFRERPPSAATEGPGCQSSGVQGPLRKPGLKKGLGRKLGFYP